MAGGFKKFGPTYNSTYYVRTGFEGDINGLHNIDPALITAHQEANGEASFALAGKMAGMTSTGINLAIAGAKNAVGLFREDLEDMVNASGKASFYFRGGEYYVAESRLGKKSADGTADYVTPLTVADFPVGTAITTDNAGGLIPFSGLKTADATGAVVIGTVVSAGLFPAGNMYEWAGDAANGGEFVGFILHM